MPTVYTGATAEVLAAVVLDPPEVATSRTALELNTDRIRVDADGVDWGTAAIEAFMAQLSRGESPVDVRFPNRQITIPLMVGVGEPEGFALAKAELQSKVALFQTEGGWLRRGDGMYAEIVNATLTLPDSKYGLALNYETEVVLTLEALPDLFGGEQVGPDHESTGSDLVFVENGVSGDHSNRVRVVVDEDAGQARLGLLGGIRSRHYSPAATAALVYNAEDLTPLDAAALATRSGSYGNDVVRHANLGTNWTPLLSTDLGSALLTHTGSYRLRGRFYSTGELVKVRAVYDVGDLAFPKENRAVQVPSSPGFYLIDLGELRLDEVPVGDHRWQGQVQAKGAVGGEDIELDRLEFQPLDEGAFRVVASMDSNPGLAAYVARDEFNQTAGALDGKTAADGSVWDGNGDGTDFQVGAGSAERTATADSHVNNGRYAISGASGVAAQAVQIDLRYSSIGTGDTNHLGVLARYIDTGNWLMATVELVEVEGSTFFPRILVRKCVTGAVTTLGAVGQQKVASALATDVSLRLYVDPTGRWLLWYWLAGGNSGQPVGSGQDDALATGGSLAVGKSGFYDAWTDSGACTRNFDNFAAWAPTSDAILFPNQSCEVRTDGVFRSTADGSGWGPTPPPIGDLIRLPASGLEDRPVEMFLRGSRGDFDQLPDTGKDPLSARAFVQPSFLFPPGS